MNNSISGNGKLIKEQLSYPASIKFIAHFLSWIFHPLFISSYVAIFLLYIHPYAFIATDERNKVFKLLFVVVNTALFPGFAVFLMWRLKLIQSMFLQTQKERIIPYALVMIFYFWAWYVSRNQNDNPEIFQEFLLGSFLSVIAAWMANIYFKVSMHALAVGGLAVFMLIASFTGTGTSGLYPSIALLITGLVSTSRLVISDHHPAEIYSGLVIGACCQIIPTVL